MKNKFHAFLYFTATLLLLLNISSCSGIVSPSVPDAPSGSGPQKFSLSGTFSMPSASALPSQLSPDQTSPDSRNAVPGTSGLTYTVTARSGGTEVEADVSGLYYSFNESLAAGTWTITACAKTADGTTVFQSQPKTATLSASVPSTTVPISMETASGSGNVSLSISWTSGSGIGYCKWESSLGSGSSDTGSATISADNKPTGSYPITISFYASSESAVNSIPLYECTEYIAVLPGLTTNSWTSGTAPHLESGFSVTAACVECFVYRKIYVKQGASDSGATGTSELPFGTIEKAMARLNEVAGKNIRQSEISGTSPWELHVNGTPTVPTSSIAGGSFIDVSSSIGHLAIIGEGSGATIDANNKGRVLNIASGASVTVQNITLKNGNSTEGGGVRVAGGATFTIKDDTVICSNTASNSVGGGIFNLGTVIMEGGTIGGTSAAYANKATRTDTSNAAIGLGGGIYCEKQGVNPCTFTMTGGSIAFNNSAKDGGGLYIGSGAVADIKGTAKISSNETSVNGGGVYALGTFKMGGSAYIPVGSNKKNDVYLYSQIITITGRLTPPSECTDGIVATITPSTYSTATFGISIAATTSPSTTIDDEYSKFAVTQQIVSGIPKDWYISDNGKLINIFDAENLTEENYNSVTTISVISADGMDVISVLADSGGKDFSGKTIRLENDVTLNSDFAAIKIFKGTFDGNNKTISGLNGQVALFVDVNGTVKDLTVEGTATSAGITKSLINGLIVGCTNRVAVTATDTAGGIVGLMGNGDSPTIRNCVNEGAITSSYGYLGGIAGRENVSGSIIDSCVNKGTVTYTGSNYVLIGGIVGSAFGIVRNCINSGNVQGGSASEVGGITGNTHSSSGSGKGTINCTNLGSVSGRNKVGGIAGNCDISGTLSYDAYVFNCYNAGSVSASSGSSGGVVGKIDTGGSGSCTTTHNYYKSGTSSVGVYGKSDSESNSTTGVPSVSDMNSWVNSNNTSSIYKTWTTSSGNPVPDVGFSW